MTDLITPPPELVQQWRAAASTAPATYSEYIDYIATHAAQWGADQELEACCQHVQKDVTEFTSHAHLCAQRKSNVLRAARRPKQLSAVAQAEALIEQHEDGWYPSPAQWHVIREGLAEGRRALEALPE